MQHRPIPEQAPRHGFIHMLAEFEVAVIAADTLICRANGLFRPLQQLKVDITPADQRARDVVALIGVPRLNKDA